MTMTDPVDSAPRPVQPFPSTVHALAVDRYSATYREQEAMHEGRGDRFETE